MVDYQENVFELTISEREVLDMLTKEFLTQKQIALRRDCTKQAVSKILKSLKKKGAYTLGLQQVDKIGGTSQPVNQIRIHAHQFIIKILYKDERYKKLLEKSNQLTIDGNTLDLYDNSIYLSLNQSFYGDNLTHAFWKCSEYMPRFIARMEHELKVLLIKPNAQNIKLTRIHIAETNNELAKQIDNTGDKWFKVYAQDDGKLRFLIDNSFNLHEFEAVRSTTARPDMEKVCNVFNDIADKEHYLPSDTKTMIDKLALISSNVLKQQQQTLLIEQEYAANIKKHLSVLSNIDNSFKTFTKEIAKFNQRKLSDY